MRETLRSALLHVGRVKRQGTLRASALVRRLRQHAAPAAGASANAGVGAAAPISALRRAARRLARLPAPSPAQRAELVAHGGQSVAGSFGNAAGTRHYKLYVAGAAARRGSAPPLVVMLHGCQQNPDDFAAGTRMNEHAEEEGWLVLYPAQPTSANHAGCWNWYQHGDQRRDAGEPSLIAGMTRDVIERYGVDPSRVYVAGLSAGGAMAATMATTYPDLYAACGVHSGLPHAAAHDLLSAMSAMRQGPAAMRAPAAGTGLNASFGSMVQNMLESAVAAAMPAAAAVAVAEDAAVEAAVEIVQRSVPTIVFHGDRDTTVHPCNGDGVIAQAHARAESALAAALEVATPNGQQPGGHAWTRTVHRDAAGHTHSEHWLVHGSGHAWSGGSAKGSFTDPLGPDASREMLRFFAAHPQQRA